MKPTKTVSIALLAAFTTLTSNCSDKQAQPAPTNFAVEEAKVDTLQPAVLEVQLILRDSERKLAGVKIDVQWDDAGIPSSTSAYSNAAGLVHLEFEHGAQLIGVSSNPSSFSAPGFIESPAVLFGGKTHKIEMVLAPAASLFGTVYDAEGASVEGAKVVCFFYSPEFLDKNSDLKIDVFTTTDKNGRFALGGVPEGSFTLEAAFENQMSVWRPGGVIDEGKRHNGLEIFIEPAHTVYGQVITANENAIANARVVAGKPNRRKNRKTTDSPQVHLYGPRATVALSDDDGMFVLPAVPDSQAWNVNVRHADYAQTFAVVDAGQIDVWIEMKDTISLDGKVIDGDGKAIRNTQLWLLTSDGDLSVGADSEGVFKFSDLKEVEDVYLIAHHPQHGTTLSGPIIFDDKSQQIEVQLRKGQSIKGRVVNSAGEAQTNVGVQIEGQLPRNDFSQSRLPERFLGIDSTLTNSNGEFQFDNLYDNLFTVSVFTPGAAAVYKRGVKVGASLEVVTGE
ncbi:MAG: carboxypeptidase regulatory-like domain-containing protein [Planctomycetes bacterium]|nr:carboxypeptidase regulatory-like domain-containing protein [Planctomycetota bacterium]